MRKKKETLVMFPTEGKMETSKPADIPIGSVIRIGRPSNRYYQYVHASLDFLNQKLKDLSNLLHLEGTMAKVIGAIDLKDGHSYVIIEKNNNELFFDGQKRLFVDRVKALRNREIIVEGLYSQINHQEKTNNSAQSA